jgi:hypothetical protein
MRGFLTGRGINPIHAASRNADAAGTGGASRQD